MFLLGTKVRLTDQVFQGPSFSSFLNISVIFPLFPVIGYFTLSQLPFKYGGDWL